MERGGRDVGGLRRLTSAFGWVNDLVTLEGNETGVAVVRPSNGKVNALSTELLRCRHEVAAELAADPPGWAPNTRNGGEGQAQRMRPSSYGLARSEWWGRMRKALPCGPATSTL